MQTRKPHGGGDHCCSSRQGEIDCCIGNLLGCVIQPSVSLRPRKAQPIPIYP
jgi:hypothetical protein